MNAKWAKEIEIINAYVDTAKTYIQLSSAGLALPLVLHERLKPVLDRQDELATSTWVVLIVAWAAFLVAVCAGALFQFAAAKYIEHEIDNDAYVPWYARHVIRYGPGYLLNVTFLSFLIGAIGIVTYSGLLLR